VPADAAASDTFGFSVATSQGGAIVAVGAPNAVVNGNALQGRTYLYAQSGVTWNLIEAVTAPDGAASAIFGAAVAASAGTVVVGAPGANVGANNGQGAAYAFVGDTLDFAFQQKLVSNDGAQGDQFGTAVGVSGDDAIVGAALDDLPGGFNQGSAYVFSRSGTTWTQQQRLDFPTPGNGDTAGSDVAISDGIAVVGGPQRDTGGSNAGQIAVFRRVAGAWELDVATGPNDPVSERRFGRGVAIDGDRIAVGGPNGPDAGIAYVFETGVPLADSGDGDSADPDGQTDDQTGKSVATAIDLMAVGAPEVDGSGVVYLYRLKGTTDLTPGCGTNLDSELVATLTNTNGIGDKFGTAVSMSSDGNTIVVGAPDFNARGRVAVFQKPAGGWTGTLDVTTADTIAPGGGVGDKFGASVAIADNGTIAAGAPGSDTTGTNAGAVMTFRPASNLYDDVAEGTVVSMSPQAGAAFGTALSMTIDRLVVGAPLEDNVAPNSTIVPDAGAAYAYSVAGSGTTTPRAAVEPSAGGGIGDKFGTSVGASGSTLVVGAPGVDTPSGTDSGAGFVYRDPGGPLQLAATLMPEDGGGQQAGNSVAIAGEYVVLGAPLANVGEMVAEGATYFYEEPETGWETGGIPPATSAKLGLGNAAYLPAGSIAPIERQPDQAFGSAVGLTRRGLAVGAPLRDDDIPNCSSDIVDEGGADAYLFERILRNGFE
jgi:hypothetical protein